ncbi:MAG: cytochrome-ba3 oxidase subunit [Halobacteria archaeon]|nr:cytochrome-ba3 oxidase subunit [Halobacteria archaeon]
MRARTISAVGLLALIPVIIYAVSPINAEMFTYLAAVNVVLIVASLYYMFAGSEGIGTGAGAEGDETA